VLPATLLTSRAAVSKALLVTALTVPRAAVTSATTVLRRRLVSPWTLPSAEVTSAMTLLMIIVPRPVELPIVAIALFVTGIGDVLKASNGEGIAPRAPLRQSWARITADPSAHVIDPAGNAVIAAEKEIDERLEGHVVKLASVADMSDVAGIEDVAATAGESCWRFTSWPLGLTTCDLNIAILEICN